MPGGVERVAHAAGQQRGDAAIAVGVGLVLQRDVDELLAGVQAHAPQASPSASATSSAVRTESFSKSTRTVMLVSPW